MSCISSLYGMCQDARSGVEVATFQSCGSCGFYREEAAADADACIHRGSQRRCCNELFLCRKFPGESCTPGASNTPELRSCLTCEQFEQATNGAE